MVLTLKNWYQGKQRRLLLIKSFPSKVQLYQSAPPPPLSPSSCTKPSKFPLIQLQTKQNKDRLCKD